LHQEPYLQSEAIEQIYVIT